MTSDTATAPTTRPDITCPKSGEMIPLDKFSISKFTDRMYLVYCPACRTNHEFVAQAAS